jgi:hypothetical protein
MKYLKRVVLAILVLIVILIAALFVVTAFYKKEIADALAKNLKDTYALSLVVDEVDVSLFENFPQASVNLKNVSLHNDLNPSIEPLLKAGSVKVSFSLRKLLKNEFEINSIAVRQAEVNLITNEDGSKNFEFKKGDTLVKKSAGLDFNIHKISIEDTDFSFTNKQRGQRIAIHFMDNTARLTKQTEGFDFTLNGAIKVAGLLFNPGKGAFLTNTTAELKLEGVLYTAAKICFIHDPSSLEIEGSVYNINSFINLGEEKSLALKINARNVLYAKGIKLVNPKIAKTLSGFAISKPMDLDLLLYTRLGIRQEPVVMLHVESKHNHITIGNSEIPYEDVSFKGFILSVDSSLTRGNEDRAIIRFSPIIGTIYEVPFKASVKLIGFKESTIYVNASLFIDAQKVKLKASEEFDLKGNCVAVINYSGPASKINKEEFLSDHMKLRARLAFRNFSYKEKHKPNVYTINGRANLTNTNLAFSNLVLKTNGGNVSLNGRVEQFTPYVLGMDNNLKINLEAYTNEFDLNPFMKVVAKKDSTKTSNARAKESAKAHTQAVRQLNNESVFDFNVLLKAKRMFIRKVVAEDVAMNLGYKNNLLNLKSVSVTTCGGKLRVSGTINKMQEIRASINVDDINVTTLFEQFENFGQQAIQSKQLKGKISLDAVFNAELDEKMEIVPYTMLGDVTLKLKEGHLIDYEPLQNVSNFIFHNRDFNDITFSELNERFQIKGHEMRIEELEIASNILNLYVSGTYNFKSHSNVNLVIPWNNLKKRGKNYIPKSSGLSAEDTKGLKLNYSGPPKKMKLSLGHK